MNTLLAAAIILTMSTSVWLVLRWGHIRCEGSEPLPLLTFLAILFTSGLDVGLIMFPLVDFQTYGEAAEYGFTNPLAIEFGFWGFLVWGFYFLTTFYFCIVEPRLKLFENPWIKHINNGVIIGTCAFTAYLFLVYLPDYIEGISEPVRFGLVATVVLLAVISSTHLRFIKVLSVTSTGLFFTLIVGAWLLSGMGWSGLGGCAGSARRLFSQPAQVRFAHQRLSRFLPVLVVCLEHHDWSICLALCGRNKSVAATPCSLGRAVHPDSGVVLGAVPLSRGRY